MLGASAAAYTSITLLWSCSCTPCSITISRLSSSSPVERDLGVIAKKEQNYSRQPCPSHNAYLQHPLFKLRLSFRVSCHYSRSHPNAFLEASSVVIHIMHPGFRTPCQCQSLVLGKRKTTQTTVLINPFDLKSHNASLLNDNLAPFLVASPSRLSKESQQ